MAKNLLNKYVWLVLKPELYTSLDQKKVIREAALRSGVSRA